MAIWIEIIEWEGINATFFSFKSNWQLTIVNGDEQNYLKYNNDNNNVISNICYHLKADTRAHTHKYILILTDMP